MNRYQGSFDLDFKAVGADDDGALFDDSGSDAKYQDSRNARAGQVESESSNIFTIEKEDGWKPEGLRLGPIRMAAAGGTTVLISTSDGNIIRWDSEGDGCPAELVELKGGRPDGGRVHSMFVDSSGRHALICLVTSGSGTCYYLYHTGSVSASTARPVAKELPSMRGFIIDSVAWGSQGVGVAEAGKAGMCGPFLVGTSTGRLLEVKGLSGDDRKDKGVSRLWEASGQGDAPMPILGLQWQASADGSRHVVLAVTGKPTRIYQFAGGPTVSAIFAAVASSSKPVLFQEVRGGAAEGQAEAPHPCPVTRRLPNPALASGSSSSSGGAKRAPGDGFAMLTSLGVYTGKLASAATAGNAAAAVRDDGVLTGTKVLPYPALGTARSGAGGDRDRVSQWEGNNRSREGEDGGSAPVPAGLVLTDFHVLLRYKSRILALSRVSASAGVVWESSLPEERYGQCRALLSPAMEANPLSVTGTRGGLGYVWLVADKALLRVRVRNEGRQAWKLYMALRDFESAKAACGGDSAKLEQVHEATAEHMFASGDVAGAAAAWARTSRPLEDTCLRLLAGGHRQALRAYVSIKLDALGVNASSKPQRTILCTWLQEMYLDRLNSLAASVAAGGAREEASASEYEETCSDLRSFLRERLSDLHAPTARALLAGHGRTPELLAFCRMTGEWGRIVAHHMSRGEWAKAVEAIEDAPTAAEMSSEGRDGGDAQGCSAAANSQEELWYRHSATLLPLLPTETVTGWKSCRSLLPLRLVPSLARYEQLRAASGSAPAGAAPSFAVVTGGALQPMLPALGLTTEAIASALDAALLYLEWVMEEGVAPKGPAARPLHNLLLSLYARLPAEDLLLTYVEQELARNPEAAQPAGASAGLCNAVSASPAVALALADRRAEELTAKEAAGGDGDELDDGPRFDLSHALRVCLVAGRKCLRTTVRLYCGLGLYIEAVETSLGGADVELAKEAADSPPKDDECTPLRKRLWVRIATHVIATGGGAQGSLDILHESCVLDIEDVLPYFPGNTTLGVFQSEVTDSLREADAQIARLRSEMRGYTQAAERIRGDIKALRSRCGAVRVGQRCELCRAPVLSRHLYLFPCAHAFHADCLMAEAVRHMSSAARRRVGDIAQACTRASGLCSSVSEQGLSVLSGLGMAGELGALGLRVDLSSASAQDVSAALAARADELQSELDASVAAECALCGDAMIDSIVVPLGMEGGDTYGSSGADSGRDGGHGAHARSLGPLARSTRGNGTDEDWAV